MTPALPLQIDRAVRQEFNRLSIHIFAALEHAGETHAIEDIWNGICSGVFQFWPAEKSAVVTEILSYPNGKRTLHFFLAGGDLTELQTMYPYILEWGRTAGCSRATLAGRPGWARTFLRKDGWEPRWCVLAKEL
jgi:hypothetical protein